MKVEARNIMKKFGDKTLFQDLNIEINGKDSIVITGDSGSGKSTLLNILSLIEETDKGTITWNDNQIEKINSKKVNKIIREEIGYIFQNYALIENKTVYENVLIGAKYNDSITTRNKKEYIYDAIKRVGLTGLENRKVYSLSGGEQQRVALARIIVKPCSIIFADEPTGNLDDENANKIIEILFDLNKEGKTIVVVTHDRSIISKFDKHVHLTVKEK
ncbi:MAG: ATP-binding cassette domain-containing protein [Alkalibacterium gilvum]|uniref:Putative ABC transport system ATP-binding protein n=1 Tax=Alkalibacterium gilvum TaxID=1130080 RepID=A0A1H6RQK6_9LACT|nr:MULTISPECIES: ATP-binding cassette domain-containing protein [Alkalibacterium]MDN6294123.1 ATP-binding cassette domain-containing protein [Alkalibacterium sp.]MDN6295837.1 ATP-binding cassette domain-containing protein [Alkalibacterium sp.]MDN6398229.1 ATP-binding cassette domain-containing protein [Alkalibacterium sp.]MDN6730170.1 ATP-binding cassette domain-containing protein [Alkalibacterium sp.]SEI58049.1 putative ABC transport system ATP-binding protein [Alkalibacterium gilvum]